MSHSALQELLFGNIYELIELNPGASADQQVASAYDFLVSLWQECIHEDDNGHQYLDSVTYIYVLEELIKAMYQDIAIMLTRCTPNLFHGFPTPEGLRGIYPGLLEKAVFNTLFPLESNGYQYPQQKLTGTYGSDTAFRVGTMEDYNKIAGGLDAFPAHWRPALVKMLKRTAEALYAEEASKEESDYEYEEDPMVSSLYGF